MYMAHPAFDMLGETLSLTYSRNVLDVDPPIAFREAGQPRVDFPDLRLLTLNQLVYHLTDGDRQQVM